MKVLNTLVLLLLPFFTMAQPSDSAVFKTGAYSSVTISGARQLASLNQQLRAAGHAPLTEALVGFSLGVTNRFADQNSYTTSRLSWLATADDNANDSRQTTLSVWELASFAHYDVVANPKWLAYPYLGFGTNYARLVVSNAELGGSFQNSLNNLGTPEVVQKKYGSEALMLFGELGGGVERVLKLQGTDLYIGLSGGYRLSTERAWVLQGVKSFASSFGTQGWMAELKFRFETNPERNPEVRRGIFRFFE